MKNCRICNTTIEQFMSFGKMPIANGFLTSDQIQNEYFFELAPAFCSNCGMFQLIEQPDPQKMFHENYAFFSSTSSYMQIHFKKFAEFVMKGFLEDRQDPFVVELGSNDGIMLRNFKKAGVRHLGIEPSVNVANVARSEGIETLSEFFNLGLADQIVERHGQADSILCANVMCHIPDLNSIAKGIKRLLKTDGVLMFEEPYLGDMVMKTSYDQIYDEHVFIFSATSVSWAFAQHGLELIDVLPQKTHGGSMRYVLTPIGIRPVSQYVSEVMQKEQKQGLHKIETYDQFRQKCEISRKDLKELLENLKQKGQRVVGYGATSKSTTVNNYCGIGPDHVEFISDTTPVKQGKLTPGMHIPVKPYEHFTNNPPDYAILFAWNHASEIFAKENSFKAGGGKWIKFVPQVEVVD